MLAGYILASVSQMLSISEVRTFPICHIFPWLCSWGGCTVMLSVSYISGESCAVSWCLQISTLGSVFVCMHITLLHYHHYADLSEGIELLKSLSDAFFPECVSRIKPVVSVILHSICGAVRIQLPLFSYNDCEHTTTILPSSNRRYDPFAIV